MEILRRVERWVSGRRTAWVVVGVAVVLSFLVISVGTGPGPSGAAVDLPASAQALQVSRLQSELPAARTTPAIVVFRRPGGRLSAADRHAISARSGALGAHALGGHASPAVVAPDGTLALVTVPLATTSDAAVLGREVDAVRATARAGLPSGLQVEVTGPAGFQNDLANVFKGADTKLLLITTLVVAVLLILTYRSPWLWLVPLATIGMAEQVASVAASRLAPHVGVTVNAEATGILSVLVFGAGTDYALLLIARYRDELRRVEDRHEAMAGALRRVAPAVLASGSTVTLSLLTLLLASIPSTRGLGMACAIGIVVAALFALVVLPAALVVFGRRLFWPAVPRTGEPNRQLDGPWGRLGRAVARRPTVVIAGSLVLLGLLATGVGGVTLGLTQTQQFRNTPESVVGQLAIQRAFPAGESEPAAIVASSGQAQQVAEVARSVPGVASVTESGSNGSITQLDAVLSGAPDTRAAFGTVEALRTAVATVPGAHALVGGPDAITLDTNTAWSRDRSVIIPIILAIILAVLVVLLRALVGPLLIIATVGASYLASLGLSQVLFTAVYKFPALDVSVPLLSFLFLAALGVDYNIFLVTRAREEAARHGTREGMVRALAVTGGVITSAGILLAAVFAVLGVLPLIPLTQVGVIVGVGVLLDTLLVRTVLVPALAFIAGDRFWWPGRVTTDRTVPRSEPAPPGPPAPDVPRS